MIYYIPSLLLFFITILYYSKGCANKSIAAFLWVIFCLYVIVLVGLRYKVGTDWYEYQLLFNDSSFDFKNSGIAFFLIKSALKYASLGFQTFVLIMFLISFVVKVIAFRKITNKYLVCLMLYFSFWYLTYETNGMKQGAALSFTLLGFYYTLKRNCAAFLTCLTMAFCFHNSAIIFLPFFWLAKFKISKILIYSIVLGTVLFSHLGLGENIIQMFADRYTDSYFAQKSISYVVDESFNNNILFSFKSLHKIAILVVVVETFTRSKYDKKTKNIVLWASLLSCVVYFSFSQFEIIAARLSLYYRVVEIFALSIIPFIYRNRWYYILSIFVLFLYSVLQIWNVLQMEDGGLLPYHNILFL